MSIQTAGAILLAVLGIAALAAASILARKIFRAGASEGVFEGETSPGFGRASAAYVKRGGPRRDVALVRVLAVGGVVAFIAAVVFLSRP